MSLSDGMAMSPEMSREFAGVAANVADGCGVVFKTCQVVGLGLGVVDGAYVAYSDGRYEKLAGVAAGQYVGSKVAGSLTVVKALDGMQLYSNRFVDGVKHVYSTFTSKAVEYVGGEIK